MNQPKKIIPLIVTERLAETRAFYLERAGFSAVVDGEGYLQVRAGDADDAPEFGFALPTAFGQPLPPFRGEGLVLSILTEDADRKAREMTAAGARDVGAPSDKPWGWRSFVVPDPNGVLLDFFHPLAETAR